MTAAALARDPDDGRSVDYLTPDGEFLAVWVATGDKPLPRVTEVSRDAHGDRFTCLVLAPIQRAEVEWLLEYACRPQAFSPYLREIAYGALGAGSTRAGFEPLTPAERKHAIRSCASQLEMLRLMGVKVGDL